MQAVLDAFDKAHSLCGHGKPVMILFKTVMGKGVDWLRLKKLSEIFKIFEKWKNL